MADLIRFTAYVAAGLLDPILLAGYLAAGWLARRLAFALIAAVGWAVVVTVLVQTTLAPRELGPLPPEIWAGRIVGAAIVAAVVFFVLREVRRVRAGGR